MSEEKMCAVKNDDGEYWDFADRDGFFELSFASSPTTAEEEDAKDVVSDYGGHVVAFIEEPEKVVLSEKQAEIVEGAYASDVPASYISNRTAAYNGEERLLMSAYTNGYTVAKEKKYRVKVPETQTSYYYKGSDGHVHASDISGGLDNEFSYSELQQYGLDGERFTKEEVTDDGMGC
ncbi:DUF1642 domain-containing protein [Lactobacillus paracasei subsp. paracasei]|uniref:DUF1642 domain-containing protein n=1 Tax=Lacticaseibacillus paracasei TaxID=1597 RepID=UPI0018C5E770|nr:DUF1642 domain-containing protein [Lacticaseibacillus paracasei]MBG1273953.1 DUF1642 domain-containing protein [Lacticaseibacillus paracasei subsp. paracasei]